MSLTGATPRDAAAGIIHTAAGHMCFYCARSTSDPVLFWLGATSGIYLHPGCWVDLSARLYRDLHEWQRQTGVYFGATR